MSHPSRLSELIEKLEKQNEVLAKARHAYLAQEASRKHFEATLVSNAPGKSHAERLTLAQSTAEWLEFNQALARLESIYEFQRLKFDIISKEFQAEYLTMKLDSAVISKGRFD